MEKLIQLIYTKGADTVRVICNSQYLI